MKQFIYKTQKIYKGFQTGKTIAER